MYERGDEGDECEDDALDHLNDAVNEGEDGAYEAVDDTADASKEVLEWAGHGVEEDRAELGGFGDGCGGGFLDKAAGGFCSGDDGAVAVTSWTQSQPRATDWPAFCFGTRSA